MANESTLNDLLGGGLLDLGGLGNLKDVDVDELRKLLNVLAAVDRQRLSQPIPRAVGLGALESTAGQLGFSPQGGNLIGGMTFTGGLPQDPAPLFQAQALQNALTLFSRVAPLFTAARAQKGLASGSQSNTSG